MKRKLVRQGQNALTITVPSKWVKDQNLSAGNEVLVKIKDDSLLLQTNEPRKVVEISEINEYNYKSIRTLISAYYKAGFDLLKLNFNFVVPEEELFRAVNSFTGLVITSMKNKVVEIECISSLEKFEFEKLMRRMLHCVSFMFSQICEDPKQSIYPKQLEMKKEVIKIRDHLIRATAEQDFGAKQQYNYYEIITTLEKIASHLVKFSKGIDTLLHKGLVKDLFYEFKEITLLLITPDFSKAQTYWLESERSKNELTSEKLNKLLPIYGFEVVYYYSLRQEIHRLVSRILSNCSEEFSSLEVGHENHRF